jgi:hypothetical protein
VASATALADQHGRRDLSSLAGAIRDTQVWSRINRLSGDQHLKYRCVPTVTSVLPTTPSFSAPRDRSFALSKRWSGQTRVAVDSDEAIVLHQISSPPGPFLWIRTTLPDAVATIDAIMVRALPGMARKHEPTER